MAEMTVGMVQPIGAQQVREAAERMKKYKEGKQSVEQRVIAAEQWWKMRRWEGTRDGKYAVHQTGWLWNVIMSKHADMMDAFPECNIRPKEAADAAEAQMLSDILPVILEQNRFRRTYSRVNRHKLGSGTGVYSVIWDKSKLHGRGDIAIVKVDVLNLFWEPGIDDIQKSREVFHTTVAANDVLEAQYPQLAGKLGSGANTVEEYIHDDTIDKSDKSIVVDWYYKQQKGGRTILQYCKFVNDVVLFASENETQRPTAPVTRRNPETGAEETLTQTDPETGIISPVMQETGPSLAERGWYDHGRFPFVPDPLFDVEESPCGYGYIDIGAGTQEDIDNLNHAIVKNAILCSKPRFFVRKEESINMEDFMDYSKDIVRTSGTLGEDAIRAIQTPELPAAAVQIWLEKINELKEISGNRDVNNGQTNAGVTAASAIAALQESAGKTSRDMIANTYEAFKEITYLCIELIRQFYDTPRQFRITGADGQDQFISYSNKNLVQTEVRAIDDKLLGWRQPEFDIEVSAQKATPYSKMSQNELALQFWNAGMFQPQAADAALGMLQMMDFAHKSDVIQTVQQNGTMLEQLQGVLQVAMGLAAKYEPQTAQMLAQQFSAAGGEQMRKQAEADAKLREQNPDGTIKPEEHPVVRKARARADAATQVNQ